MGANLVVWLPEGAEPPAGLDPALPRVDGLAPGAPVLVVAPGVTALAADAVAALLDAARETTAATVSAVRADTLPGGPAGAPLRPSLGAPEPGCVLVTRAALDLVPDAADLAELAARTTALGLVHLLAGDAVVTPAGSTVEAPAPAWAVQRARSAAALRDRRLSVTIDGRALGPYWAGTQVHLLELIAALARTGATDLRVVVAHDLDARAGRLFAADDRITTITYDAAAQGAPATDIVHRPNQVFSADDLALLLPLGDRLVVTHQDQIGYHSPAYADDREAWERLRLTTSAALAAADRVVFFSAHARDDALRDDLVTAERAAVVAIGVDHRATGVPAAQPPAGIDPERPFLLCLGADLPHKNHPFARALHAALDWDGDLVFAGPDSGLGPVSDAEKAWLLAHAAAVLYPTLYEGFGLVPFEAGLAGTPCAFAPVSALAETLGPELAVIEPWDAAASAARLRPLLDPGPARDAHVAGLRRAAASFTWDRTATAMLEVYAAAVASPSSEGRRHGAERTELVARLDAETEARHTELRRHRDERASIGEDAVAIAALLGPHDQRALLAAAGRPALRRPLMAVLRAAYKAAKLG